MDVNTKSVVGTDSSSFVVFVERVDEEMLPSVPDPGYFLDTWSSATPHEEEGGRLMEQIAATREI